MQDGYLNLKLSWELFKKAPDALLAAERQRLDSIARRQHELERGILAAPEASGVVVPDNAVASRVLEIAGRYPSHEDFEQEMAVLGLDKARLGEALARELRVEAVLEKVAGAVPPVSEIDAELYYPAHLDAFEIPEARSLRHILITYNDREEKARVTVQLKVLRSNARGAEAFGKAALRHSQCPTAMQEGILGLVLRGQLYPELEPAAFALARDEISDVLESPIGLHILRCDAIQPRGLAPFAEVATQIGERLNERRRRKAQQDWIREQAVRA